jgi:multidrug efflux pump subunit AcrB
MNIGRFSVRHPVLINILMVTLLIFGVFAIMRMPKEQFSEVPFFWVNVIVPYPGVSANDVEKTVTVPLENQFSDLESLKRIQSVTSEGLSVVRVEFDDGISEDIFKRLFQEVQTRALKVSLPDGTLAPLIDDFSAADFLPVIEVVLSGDTDFEVLNREALRLEEQLQNVRDISTINIVGSRDRQVLVRADRQKLESLGILIDEIVRAIRSRSVTVPAGTLSTASREYLLRTVGELSESDEFRNVIVRRSSTGGEGIVHVGDVASVTEGFDPEGTSARFNGERSISLKIAKVSGGDSLVVSDGVKRIAVEQKNKLPEGISIEVFGDSTIQIRRSIQVLVDNFLFGFLLLLFILFIFLGLRNALIIAAGLPVTFAMTFIVLDYLGETVNTNTLFGLVLVLGLVVDHAIVIIENSYRLEQEGLSKIDAAVEGTNQVVLPVIAATATTVAAFLPLMILPGTIGRFLRVIPLVVSVALIVSTFEALVFLPVHFAEWSGKAKQRAAGSFDWLRKRYSLLLGKVYKHRKKAVAGFTLITILSFGLIPLVRQDLFSAEDFSLFYIELELPPGSPVEKSSSVVAEFEKRLIPLIGNGEVTSISSSIGFMSGDSGNTRKSNAAEIVVDLTEQEERKRSIPEIIKEVEALCADIPGAERVRYRKATNGPPTAPPVSFRLLGDDYSLLTALSGEIQRKLTEYPELYNIDDNVESGTPELRVTVREEAAARYGLSSLSIGSYLRSSFDGVTATTIFRNNESIDVLVRYDASTDFTVQSFYQLSIPTADGRLIPFNAVASLSEVDAVASIKRVDGKREVTINSEAYDESRIRDINREVEAYYNANFAGRYPGVELKAGGEFAEFANLLIQILQIFLIGIFLIYVILGTQFNSYAQPFLILFSVPFAFVGVIMYLVVSGTPFSTTVLYAGVALAGIAVNDSIVLISFINELKEKNYATEHAVVEAAVLRIRPIVLTSITTIAGLVPTALGLGGQSVVWGPMASTIIFGLFFSTATALLIIPAVYGVWDDISSRRIEKKRLRSLRRGD